MLDLPTWSTLPDWEIISETSASGDVSTHELNHLAKQQHASTGKRRRPELHASSQTPPTDRKRRHISPGQENTNRKQPNASASVIKVEYDAATNEARMTPNSNAILVRSGNGVGEVYSSHTPVADMGLVSHAAQSPPHTFMLVKPANVLGEGDFVNDNQLPNVVAEGSQSILVEARAQTITYYSYERQNTFSRFPQRSLIPVSSSHSSSSSVDLTSKNTPIRLGHSRPRQAQLQWVPLRAAATKQDDIPLEPRRELGLEELETLTEADVAPSVWEHQYLERASESEREAALRWNLRHIKKAVELQGRVDDPTVSQDQSKTRSIVALPTMSRSLRRDQIIDSIFGRNSEDDIEDAPGL